MSLTNDQIMAKNFQDFYAQIRPYLNGQVPPVFNKFSKSDLYSTDERIVGQWIDGKPLYQKTIDCGALPSNTTKQVDSGVTGISRVINMYGYAYKSSNYQTIPIGFPASSGAVSLSFYSDTGKVNITTTTNRSDFAESYVVIQYTKTADNPVSIGNDTDYSTTEKIVGTWIDGKPVYQKTFNLSLTVSKSSWTSTSVDSSTFATVIRAFGITNSGTYQGELLGWNDNGTLKLQSTRNDVDAHADILTIQYTKTTD